MFKEVCGHEFLFLSRYYHDNHPWSGDENKVNLGEAVYACHYGYKYHASTEMIFHGELVAGICELPSFGAKSLLIDIGGIFPLVVCLAALTSRENSVL